MQADSTWYQVFYQRTPLASDPTQAHLGPTGAGLNLGRTGLPQPR